MRVILISELYRAFHLPLREKVVKGYLATKTEVSAHSVYRQKPFANEKVPPLGSGGSPATATGPGEEEVVPSRLPFK